MVRFWRIVFCMVCIRRFLRLILRERVIWFRGMWVWFDFCLILGFGGVVGLPWFGWCGFDLSGVWYFGFPVDLSLMWVDII